MFARPAAVDDPERLFKLKECCDLLLAGGYFRARISTLSPFDKVRAPHVTTRAALLAFSPLTCWWLALCIVQVVGGMVWSITASGVDVDVDIIFQENSTIGQKIKLSDQLVKALVKMASPYPLQSHQIQGLDYDHLFPVLQWLVRKVIEHRRLTGDLIRAQSLNHFSKSYQLPSDIRPDGTIDVLSSLTNSYARPQRKFRKKTGSHFDTATSRTEATLLEYGERIQALAATAEDEEKEARAAERGSKGRSSLANKFEKEKTGATSSEQEAAARAELERKEQARLEALRGQLDEAGIVTRISGQNIGQLVGLQSAEIAKAAQDYEEMMARAAAAAEEDGQGGLTKRGQEQAFARQLDAMKRKIAAAREAAEKRQQAANEAEAKQAELQARFNKEEKRINKIHVETAKLEALESNSANKEILAQLRALVSLNESLKQQEAAFKESCAAQRKEYKDLLASLDPSSTAAGEGDEETQRMRAVEAMYAKEMETLNKLRRVLARKNQEIASTRRRIDEVPTRAELLQFQYRFVELYELSSEKHTETKKFFELYNSLNQSYEYMQTEVKLLNSIIEGYPGAVLKGNVQSRAEFLSKLEKILEGVDSNKKHVEEEMKATLETKSAMQKKYNAAVDQQRMYVKLKKEFKEESIKNEKLSAMLDEQQAATGAEQ